MSSRLSAFALVASLIVLGALSSITGAFAQEDDLWYPGEGVQADTYVHYRIEEIDTNNEQPYEMIMYFQEQDEEGDWTVLAYVIDDSGSVFEGTMKLSDSMAYLAGGSEVPQEMNDYIGGYSSSLHWLDAFTTKANPLSLSAASWGRIACIGCAEIKPTGQETITVAGESVDTTVVGWTRGQMTNKIWIENGFVFPVKALTHADVTTGRAPVLFEFELLERGTGQPEAPEGAGQIPTPPLARDTPRGTYTIGIDWEPASIQPDSDVIFTVTLTDNTGFPLENANYDFAVKDANGTAIQEFINQDADAEFGTGTHEIHFTEAGPVTVTVTLNSVSGQPAGGGTFTESVDFNVVVVPEFPVSAAIVAAAIVGLVVILTRARGSSLGGLFGNRGSL
jgi:hypothetical protein